MSAASNAAIRELLDAALRSGHPTGAEVSGDEALSGLLLFPGFYEFVGRVIKALPSPAATRPG